MVGLLSSNVPHGHGFSVGWIHKSALLGAAFCSFCNTTHSGTITQLHGRENSDTGYHGTGVEHPLFFRDVFGTSILIVVLEGLFYHNSCTDILLNDMVVGLDGPALFLCCIFSVAGRVGCALHCYGRWLAFYGRDDLHGSLAMVTRYSCSGCDILD